jgi:CheY-like chemotaxis protein
MAGSFSLALVGFPESESATFESFFRLAARRPPAYVVQDEVLDAQVLVVNADNAQAVHLVRHAQLQGRVLLIGHGDAGTGWPLQRKPVKLVGVLAALDELVGARPRAAATFAPPVGPRRGADPGFAATEPLNGATLPPAPPARARRRSPDTEFPPTRPMVRERAQPPAPPVLRKAMAPMPATSAQPVGVMRVTDFGALDPVPASAPSARAPASRSMRSKSSRSSERVPDVQRGDVLLVAESLVEGRILHKRFKRYGLNIDWSREAPQALALLKEHPYRLVAIDRIKGESDAYTVCRSAKQRKLPNGNTPVVLMFAPTAGSMDRIKAGLAGCDAYLSRSVGEAEFYRVLAQHRLVNLDGFERTNIGF